MADALIIDLAFLKRLRNDEDDAAITARRLIFTRVYLVLQDKDAADDITQDVYAKLKSKKWRSFKPKAGKGTVNANFRGWLKTVSNNAAIDFLRKPRETSMTDLDQAWGLSQDDHRFLDKNYSSLEELLSCERYCLEPLRFSPLWKLDAAKIVRAIMSIQDKKKRMAFVLKFGYGLTIEETARALKVNVDKLQTDLYRTRDKIRERLEAMGITASHLDQDTWKEKHVYLRRQHR